MAVKNKAVIGIKNLDASLIFIRNLYRSKKITLNKADSIELNISARMVKKGNEFLISSSRTTNSKIFYKRKKIKKIKATWAKRELILENPFINSLSPVGFEAELGAIRDVQFSDKKKQYQRLIIPTKSRINFLSILEYKSYQTTSFHSKERIKVNFANFHLDIYLYKDEAKKTFLIVDCSIKISHDEFSDAAFASLVALGYVTGKLIQDEGVYLNYSTKEMNLPVCFKFMTLRPSNSSIFYPLESIPRRFGVKGRKGENLYKKMKPISGVEFSLLCQLVLKKTNLRVALLMMMEALKGSVFTVAAGMGCYPGNIN